MDRDRPTVLPEVTGLRLSSGVFSGHVTGARRAPEIEMVIDGTVAGAVRLEAAEGGGYRLKARLPREALSEGTVAVVFRDRETGAGLTAYPVRAGVGLDDDLAAEVAALRGELEVLKRAFMAEAWHEKLATAERPVIIAEVLAEVERLLAGRGGGGD